MPTHCLLSFCRYKNYKVILLRFPINILQEMYFFNASLVPDLITWWPLCNLLLVVNHSINFVVYFVFLESFRSTFYQIFGCKKAPKNGKKVMRNESASKREDEKFSKIKSNVMDSSDGSTINTFSTNQE